MSRLDSRGIQDIIAQLTANRKADLSKIEGLFDQFGVAANQDIARTQTKETGRRQQDLISRGLSQTTRRETSLTDIATQAARSRARVGEQVAGAKAGFLERQLVNPAMITSLINAASAANTKPVQASLGASAGQASINAGQSGLIRPGGGGGGGGSGGSLSASGLIRSGSGGGGGGRAQGARIVQSPNRVTPSASIPERSRVVSAAGGQQPAPTKRSSGSLTVPSGTGTISNTRTGEGFATQTGQETPTAFKKKDPFANATFDPKAGFFISNDLINRRKTRRV